MYEFIRGKKRMNCLYAKTGLYSTLMDGPPTKRWNQSTQLTGMMGRRSIETRDDDPLITAITTTILNCKDATCCGHALHKNTTSNWRGLIGFN
jgi:hypothetical protein